MSELGTATTHLPIREALPTPFPPELIIGLKQLDFENRTERVESRGLERNRPFGEEIGQFFRSGVKVKLEIATNIGLNGQGNCWEKTPRWPIWRSERDSNSRYGSPTYSSSSLRGAPSFAHAFVNVMSSRVATRWRFFKSKRPPRKAAFQ